MSKGPYILLDSTANSLIDKTLYASSWLKNRLTDVYHANKNTKKPDPRPDIYDITQSHNMVFASTFRPHVPCAYTYYKSPTRTSGAQLDATNSTIEFSLTGNNGHWIHDQVVNIVIAGVGNQAAEPGSTSLRYRYTHAPGIRLCKKIEFIVGEKQAIETYYPDDVLAEEMTLNYEHYNGMRRCLGQEDPQNGYYYFIDQEQTQIVEYHNGPQTLKSYQPALSLWIPLRFWYNRNIAHSLNYSRFKSLQITVRITLAPIQEILQCVDTSVSPMVFAPLPSSLSILRAEMYTKNIYTEEYIHDLFTGRLGSQLIRVRKHHEQQVVKRADSILLNNLRFPIEHMIFGFKPIANLAIPKVGEVAAVQPLDWTKYASIRSTEVPIPAIVNNPLVMPTQQLVVRTVVIYNFDDIVNVVGFTISGEKIIEASPTELYNKYIPSVNKNITPPKSNGLFIMPFALDPNSRDMSGHANISTAREFYINYESSYISASAPAYLHISATCLNFVVYNPNDILALEYST